MSSIAVPFEQPGTVKWRSFNGYLVDYVSKALC